MDLVWGDYYRKTFPFVAEKIMQMPFVQHECNFSPECDAVFGLIVVVVIELTPFGLILLSVW